MVYASLLFCNDLYMYCKEFANTRSIGDGAFFTHIFTVSVFYFSPFFHVHTSAYAVRKYHIYCSAHTNPIILFGYVMRV